MNGKQWALVQLGVWLAVVGGAICGALPGGAEETSDEFSVLNSKLGNLTQNSKLKTQNFPVSRVRDLKKPATTVKQWVAQMEAAQVQVTGVKLERTETGLDIVLETAEGKPLTIDVTKFRQEGNSLIADIPNAVLALPQGQTFVADNPTADIATVQVEQRSGNIRVSVAGKEALPKTEVTLKTGGLAYSLNPEADEPDEEIVVTGERDGFRVPNASVGTRTDTPLRDIPQSIQVIPQQVLQDQNVTNLNEALRNVPGVGSSSPANSFSQSSFTLRGFNASGAVLWNGLRLNSTTGAIGFDAAGIERIEVLKGPASVLYGQGGLGGIVNYVTKQPLREPYYTIEASAGNFNFYRGAIDLSGPVNDSKAVFYRLNLAAQNTESIVDFFDGQRYFAAPSLTFQIGDRTKLTLAAAYLARLESSVQSYSLPAIGTALPNPNGKIPRNRSIGEPDDRENSYSIRAGYDLEHRFSDNWQLRNAFQFTQNDTDRRFYFSAGLAADNRTLSRGFSDTGLFSERFFNSDTYVVGQFSTGNIRHQLVAGINLTRKNVDSFSIGRRAAPIDLFNPVYGQPLGDVNFRSDRFSTEDALGIYVQDQITLAENLKLLVGGRFDTFSQTNQNFLANTETSQSGNAFSPRVGIVYQPFQPISLYASYSRSFTPTIGTGFGGDVFQPERGTQYEVGVKADLNSRLAATLAFYDLTKSNVLTEDTRAGVPPGQFSIQVGEQNSRGVEFTLQGEILPGWNIIAGYAYTDAKVTKDNKLPVGLRFTEVAENTVNLWTSYEFQRGPLKGFGGGVGLFFVGERQGDFDNTFQLPTYLRTDAAIFYKRDRLRVALNFRNLFDVDYIEIGFSRNRVYRGDPFTVQGTISYEF